MKTKMFSELIDHIILETYASNGFFPILSFAFIIPLLK